MGEVFSQILPVKAQGAASVDLRHMCQLVPQKALEILPHPLPREVNPPAKGNPHDATEEKGPEPPWNLKMDSGTSSRDCGLELLCQLHSSH
jgi:hypothetical protein